MPNLILFIYFQLIRLESTLISSGLAKLADASTMPVRLFGKLEKSAKKLDDKKEWEDEEEN